MRGKVSMIRADCMDWLREQETGAYDLAIVDPPYGGGYTGGTVATGDKIERRGGGWMKRFTPNGKPGADDDIRAWDIPPTQEYFDELFRVSKHQIIFGGNYFQLPPTRCYVVWRKTHIRPQFRNMSPVEYAWTSFDRNPFYIEMDGRSFGHEKRIHPTQKPVRLYEAILSEFAESGWRICDTHAGSASSLIACYNLGFTAVGVEKSASVFEAANERLRDHMVQVSMLDYALEDVPEC